MAVVETKPETKVALITGASKELGMGFASARKLASKGFNVVLTDIPSQLDALKERAATIEMESGQSALAAVCDVTEPESAAACVEQVLEHFGRIDVLFNNAGIGGMADIMDADIELYDRMYRVNVRGPVIMCQAVIPHLQERGSGVIINSASVAGIYGTPGLTHYCASKHAVVGFTKSLAGEMGKHGIRVLAICPGLIATDMYAEALNDAGLGSEETKAEMEAMAEGVSLGRWAQAGEVGDFVAYLASDEASYIAGSILQIHGGFPVENMAS